ncbi:hypothetical protein, partial [Devosia sp. A369]
ELFRQIPALERCRLIQGVDLLLDQRQVMQRIEDDVFAVPAPGLGTIGGNMHIMVSAAVMATLAFTIPVDAAELVGAIVPPYPNGMLSDMGTCIPMGEDFCAYSIAALNEQDGSVSAVPGQKLLDHADGIPSWEIIASLDVPERTEGQLWAFEECYVDDVPDPSVIGLVRAKDMGGWLQTEDTLWAVRFDVRSNQLMQLDSAHVKCVLPGS